MPGSRRLSDVDEGGAAGAPGVEGALDDLLPMDEVFEGGHEAGEPSDGRVVTCVHVGHKQAEGPAASVPGHVTWQAASTHKWRAL